MSKMNAPYNSENLAVIDWDKAIKLAGNKPDLAKDILAFFIKQLPQDLEIIRQAHAKKDYSALQKQAHKLHGAVCYCGLPKLQYALSSLENALKQKQVAELETLVASVTFAAHEVLAISLE